jgi:hypothetical protein
MNDYQHELTEDDVLSLLAAFPYGRGWIPGVTYRAGESHPYRADLRRSTPNGPDLVYCGDYAAEREAWAACADTGRRMLEVWESGDTALMALMRASIKYAPAATPEQWAAHREFWNQIPKPE